MFLLPYVSSLSLSHTYTHTGCTHSSENSKRCQQTAATRVALHPSSYSTHQANPTGEAEGENWKHIHSSWGHFRSHADSGKSTNISCRGTPHSCEELHSMSPPGSTAVKYFLASSSGFHHFQALSLDFTIYPLVSGANTILLLSESRSVYGCVMADSFVLFGLTGLQWSPCLALFQAATTSTSKSPPFGRCLASLFPGYLTWEWGYFSSAVILLGVYQLLDLSAVRKPVDMATIQSKVQTSQVCLIVCRVHVTVFYMTMFLLSCLCTPFPSSPTHPLPPHPPPVC